MKNLTFDTNSFAKVGFGRIELADGCGQPESCVKDRCQMSFVVPGKNSVDWLQELLLGAKSLDNFFPPLGC